MQAALQTGIHQIEVRDIPAPVPAPGAAIVRVLAAGICGSDLHPYHDRAEAQSLPDGHEVAGEIVHLPDGYKGALRIGDLVAVEPIGLGTACGECPYCLAGQPFHCPHRRAMPNWGGGFAELMMRRLAGIFRLPEGMTAEQGALVEPLAVGVHAIRWTRMPPGATVAIVGAGTIGLMSLIAARALGAGAVHVFGRHEQQVTLARELGAATALRLNPFEAVEQLRSVTGGAGADLVIETVGGHGDTVDLAWELARVQGTVAVLGIFPDRVPVNLLQPVMRELWATFPICYGEIDGRHDFDVAIELIASGQAPVERLVTHRFPLAEAGAAFRTAADKATGSIKVHIRPE